jgi:L-lactate dehydrogenase complex protein LldG
MNRDAFLGRVSQGILEAELPPGPRVESEMPGTPPDDLVALFRVRAQAVNSVVHGPVSRHSAPRTVAAIAAGHSVSTFVAWDDLPISGVSSALAAEGCSPVEPLEQTLSPSDVARADLGVTGSIFGLAESGSVVLSHGPGRARLTSLLPTIHIALLHVDTVVWTLSHWASNHPEALEMTANLVIVTGPSRTGDIELQLNLGVHGPKHMHVVLIK